MAGLSHRRLFAALLPPPVVVAALADQFPSATLPGKAVPPENWHVTLRFFGSVDTVTYDRLLGAIDQSDLGAPIDIRLRGLGTFPNPERATVLWLGVEGEGLDALAGQLEAAAQAAGLDPEERPFRPHLTLARIRPPQSLRHLEHVIDLKWRASQVHMMASDGSRYRILDTFEI